MAHKDGMNYAPEAKGEKVCKPGDFVFSAIGLDHGHIFGMCKSLVNAGGQIKSVYDDDPKQLQAFRDTFPDIAIVSSEKEILDDKDVQLVATAAVPSERGPLGLRVMDSGKHFFSDKAPFTTMEQLDAARKKTAETGLIWAVCYSERLQNESAIMAGKLIEEGAVGRVLQVIGLGPHRLKAASRPEWFFQKKYYGGILIDIGSHQIEQFLFYAGAKDAEVNYSAVANYAHSEYPELEDFGEASLTADNGVSNYYRVDWFNPDGLRTWGDGRTVIIGTEGYIELRKYIDVARSEEGDQLYIVDNKEEKHISCKGKTGFPYFGKLILDVLEGTCSAMPQEHTFKAAELCIKAQQKAKKLV